MTEIIKWDGNTISKPGIYSGVPIEVYHSDCCDGPSVSSSGLRKIVNESPADYWDSSYLNPAGEKSDESKALTLGRAVHHLILGEKDFARAFIIQPKTYVHPTEFDTRPWNNNVKDPCKKWNAEQKAAHRTILTDADVEIIKGMAKSLARDEMVRVGLLNGLVEHSMFWKDKKTGLWIKIRPDTIPIVPKAGASADVSDLKTIVGVDYRDCRKSVRDNGYYAQAALIRQGFKEVLKCDISTFTLMFVEKKRPFSTRPFILEPDDMDLGDTVIRTGLDVMARCIINGSWPGPGRGPGRDILEKLQMTPYDREEIEARIMRLKDTFELNR